MLVVYIVSLLLALPPLTVSVYLWTSVARFYGEIKYHEENDVHVSQKQTMRLIGNLILNQPNQDLSFEPRSNSIHSNLRNQVLKDSISCSAIKKDGLNNTIVMKNLNHLKQTKDMDHKNDL